MAPNELSVDQLKRVIQLRDSEIKELIALIHQLGGTDQQIADSIAGLSDLLSQRSHDV